MLTKDQVLAAADFLMGEAWGDPAFRAIEILRSEWDKVFDQETAKRLNMRNPWEFATRGDKTYKCNFEKENDELLCEIEEEVWLCQSSDYYYYTFPARLLWEDDAAAEKYGSEYAIDRRDKAERSLKAKAEQERLDAKQRVIEKEKRDQREWKRLKKKYGE